MMEAIIQCENLVKIYKVGEMEILALQGLDLTVQRGELMGIVGVSAAFMVVGGAVGRNKAFVLFFMWVVSVIVLSGGDGVESALAVMR